MSHLTIDCDDCVRQHTPTCEECVVTFICSRTADDAVVVDASERLALRRLSAVGLLPDLHHGPRSG